MTVWASGTVGLVDSVTRSLLYADGTIYFFVRESGLSDDGERTAVYRLAICLSRPRQPACGAVALLFFSSVVGRL